jgi:hypothetical protein
MGTERLLKTRLLLGKNDAKQPQKQKSNENTAKGKKALAVSNREG